MKTGKIVLWIVVAVFAWIAVASFSDSSSSSDPNTGKLSEALGTLFGTVFGMAAAALAVALLLWRSKTAEHRPMPDDPNVAAKPAPFWTMALGATAVALVAGLWAIVAGLRDSTNDGWSFLVIPLLMLLAGGFFFGHFSRRRPWLVSLFLIVPNPLFWFMVGAWLDSQRASPGYAGEISGSNLILPGALVAAPLIGVGLALARRRFRPPGPPDSPPGPPDPVISKKGAIVVAIIGVIISAVIILLFNFGLVPPDAGQALSLASTISQPGGLLIFFFALLMTGPWPPDSGKPKKAAIVVAIIGVIISAVISLILNLGLYPLDAANAPMVRHALFLASTISQAGGLLVFFFALLMRGPGSPDLGEPVKTIIVVAIIGVIISAVITQISSFGLLPHDSMNAPMVRHALSLTSTISRAGGLLIFFFALLGGKSRPESEGGRKSSVEIRVRREVLG